MFSLKLRGNLRSILSHVLTPGGIHLNIYGNFSPCFYAERLPDEMDPWSPALTFKNLEKWKTLFSIFVIICLSFFLIEPILFLDLFSLFVTLTNYHNDRKQERRKKKYFSIYYIVNRKNQYPAGI